MQLGPAEPVRLVGERLRGPKFIGRSPAEGYSVRIGLGGREALISAAAAAAAGSDWARCRWA